MHGIRRCRGERSAATRDLPHPRARTPCMPTRRELLTGAAGAALALALPEALPARIGGGTPLALVTADLDAHVVAVDLGTGRAVARIRTLPGPRSIEAAWMTWAVIAHTATGELSVLDAPTLEVRHVVRGLVQPRYTATLQADASASVWSQPGSALAYVTDSRLQVVATLDVRRGRLLARTAVPGPARHVSLSPDGGTLWTALGTKADTLAVLDVERPTRPRLVRTVRPPEAAHDVVFAPDGRHVWVTSGSARRIWVYETAGRRPVAELLADEPPQHVAWVDGRAFVASGESGTVRVHRQDGALVDVTDVPVGSYNVAFGWQRAVTPSLERGTVTLLDPRGRVRSALRVARSSHDACVVVGR